MQRELTKGIIKDAEMLLSAVNRGVVNIPQLKVFLAKVAELVPPSAKNYKKIQRMDYLDSIVK